MIYLQAGLIFIYSTLLVRDVFTGKTIYPVLHGALIASIFMSFQF